MKSLIASIAILGIVGMVVGVAVQGATEAGVAATVTVQNISVAVTDGGVVYGTLGTSISQDTTSGNLNDTQTAANNGNVIEDFLIRGQNSSGGWALAASIGDEQYMHEFSTDSGSSWTALDTTGNQTLDTGVTAGTGTQDFDLKITTPSSTTVFTEQSVDVTVIATAS